jgi:methionyl-tRNA synthetase
MSEKRHSCLRLRRKLLTSKTKPLKHFSEESYFFRMSKYHDALAQYIQVNPEFIQPANHRNAILSKLREPLLDLSISRTSFS